MFSKLAFIASLAVLAVATPTPQSSGQCNTGPVQCCQSTSSASDPATATLLGLLGIVAQGVDVPIGITCSPITVRQFCIEDQLRLDTNAHTILGHWCWWY